MCGISGIISNELINTDYCGKILYHRGPDNIGDWISEDGKTALFHNRLTIIDLSEAGNQPMLYSDGNLVITFNGEIYNYQELKKELSSKYSLKTESDTEVILASFKEWGPDCLNKFIGMFAFAIWNKSKRELFAATDRFGVKPFNFHLNKSGFYFASEIKALHKMGIEKVLNESIWAAYFMKGIYDHSYETFWGGINKLEGGHYLYYKDGDLSIERWYNPIEIINNIDTRSESQVEEELLYLLENSVSYRFVADVPVGICLSGGLDSSMLIALIRRTKGNDFPLQSFTFYTNDQNYDEVKFVKELANVYKFDDNYCHLDINEISRESERLSYYMDEPYGGIPTIAMSKVYKEAHDRGLKVLLDGNGLDEGWVGYDYYFNYDRLESKYYNIQGSKNACSLTDYMTEDFKKHVKDYSYIFEKCIEDKLSRLQYRDIRYTKIPRAMRFADRNAMSYSVEVREPYLDHRIIELGLRQPVNRKLKDGTGKYLVRNLATRILKNPISGLLKRPVQTPQREWLKGGLNKWALDTAFFGIDNCPSHWFKKDDVKILLENYKSSDYDNSFFFWQIVNLGLLMKSTVLK